MTTAAKFRPKGSHVHHAPVVKVAHVDRHSFYPSALDPVSCSWCRLPESNGRHRLPSGDAA